MKLWNKIHIHILTYFILLISLLSGLFKYILIISLIVLVHECGHILVCLYFKRSITSVEILPFGGLIKIDSFISENIYEDMLISIAGIFMQVVLGIIVFLLYKYNLINIWYYDTFKMYNVIIILFNLLPLCPLDGYKIVKLISELFIPYKNTFVSSLIISLVVLIILFIYKNNIIYDNSLVFIFIIISTLNEYKNKKYYLVRFYLERLYNKFNYKIVKISNINNMYKNKLHIINNISEKEYLKREVFSKVS